MNAIFAALVNGAILGAGITLLVWLMLRLTPRSILNAATRYAIWWAALGLAVALPALYLPRSRPNDAAPRPVISIQPASAEAAEPFAPATLPDTLHRPDRRAPIPDAAPRPSTSSVTASMPAVALASSAIPGPRAGRSSFPIQVAAGRWPLWVLLAWSLVSLCLLLRLARSCWLLRRASARASEPPAVLKALARTWPSRCGSGRRAVRLATSNEISIPVAVGPLNPSILIPARLLTELDTGEVDQIGLHETAHLARGDDYALLLQRILESVFALHPVVRWVARQIDLEREIACDDFVIAATGQPRSYATCLTRVVELAGGVASPVACANAADDRSHLFRRVDLLLDKTRHTGTRLLRARLLATVAALGALVWMAGKAPGVVAFAEPAARMAQAVARPVLPQAMLAQAAPALQNSPRNLNGRVMEDDSGNPLPSAEVRFHRDGMRELAADLDTDRQGRFQVSGLPAGDYRVEIVKPNFVTESLRLRIPAPALSLRLVRYGVITGRVTDAEGRPLPAVLRAPLAGPPIGGVQVAVLVKPEGSGALELVRRVPLDDDGIYRVHDLPPGQYAIGVWYDGQKNGSGVQLYPDTAHPRFFAVSGGEEYTGVDFTIGPRTTYAVSGQVPAAGRGSQFSLALGWPDQPALPIAQTLTRDDGSFKFEKVPAGTYDLFVGGPGSGWGPMGTVLGPEPRFGRTRIQVSQNVDGLSIPVSQGRSLTVILAAHGGGKLPAGCPQSVNVLLIALEPLGLQFGAGGQASFGKEQTIQDLAPARYRVTAIALGAGCYQTNQPVADLTGGDSKPVTIELAAAGSLRGTLRSSTAPRDFAVVLIDPGSAVSSTTHVTFPDARGRFAFDGLAPGRYRIAAQSAADASKTRWVADSAAMREIDVTGGQTTTVALAASGTKGGR